MKLILPITIMLSIFNSNSFANDFDDQRIDLMAKYGMIAEKTALEKKLEIRQQIPSEKLRIENAKRFMASLQSSNDTDIHIKMPPLSIKVD